MTTRTKKAKRTPEIARAIQVADRIAPLLAGQGPLVQAAALGLLVAQWACGHHPESVREPMLRAHFKGVRAMVKQMSESAGDGTTIQ